SLFFVMENTDGADVEDGDIAIGWVPVQNGQPRFDLFSPEDYSALGRSELFNDYFDVDLFGWGPCDRPQCPDEYVGIQFMVGWEDGDIKEGESFEDNQYFLLKYPDNRVDTLHYKYVLNPGFEYDFDYYINDEPQNLYGDGRIKYLKLFPDME